MVGRSCNEAFECSATLWLPMDTTWSVTPIKVNSLKSIATSISTDGETIIVQSQSPTLETTSYYVQSGKARSTWDKFTQRTCQPTAPS